ncbi:MAG: regulatory iron-sulfur-containing complex subunit RicT [Chloroflexota bacterium]|nr:regulatory iron-sulfur-containing complex subunit RicT [Chloroflexota bacterium]
MTELLMEAERTIPRAVAGVRFHKVGKVYHFDYSDFPDLQVRDWVIVETVRGRQMGEVTNFAAPQSAEREYKTIQRRATPRDLVLKQFWESKEAEALELCRRKSKEMQVSGVKFIAALYSFDGGLLTFLYTAEDKASSVSRLWQELNRQFPAQLELRQIGPRDVAKLLGGFGACGEMRCCSTFLTDFSPVSIKMAKMQGISLNPSEITGMCGRLRCCLVYEYEQYVAARAQLPKRNKRVGTAHGEGKVIDVLPLQDAVLVVVGDTFYTIKREELIPLDELEALAKKSSEPCTKHGDGPCECGAKPGKAAAEADGDSPDAIRDETINLSGVQPGLRIERPIADSPRGERRRDDHPAQEPRGDARPSSERRDKPRGAARPSGERRDNRDQRPARGEKPTADVPVNAAEGERQQAHTTERPPRNERGQKGGAQPERKRREDTRNPSEQRAAGGRNEPSARSDAPSDAPARGGTPNANPNKKSRRGGKNKPRRDARPNQSATPNEAASQDTLGREQTPRSETNDGSTDGG